jgi:1-deoxy-D-xylulose-5-phosphate synthase
MPKSFTDIPLSRPDTPLLDAINAPADLRQLNEQQLLQITDELRAFMLFCVGKTGGHFGAGLGVAELTVVTRPTPIKY